MPENSRVTAFTVSELLRENQQKVKLLPSQIRVKRETLAQVFSCEFYEISKNIFFIEHVWATASVD